MDPLRTRSCLTPLVILAVLVALPMLWSAGAAEAGGKQRPPVSFPHAIHFDLAPECLSCHHDMQNGENVLDEALLSETEPDEVMSLDSTKRDQRSAVACVSCHGKTAKTGPMKAFHNQCITCHEVQKAGPVMCGECHVKP